MSADALRAVLAGVLPPFCVAFVALLPRLFGGPRRDGIGWLGALGLGLGLSAASYALVGGWRGIWPPSAVLNKLAWVGLGAGALGALDHVLQVRRRGVLARAALGVAGSAALFWWLLAFLRQRAWSAVEALAWTLGLALAVAALAGVLELEAARRSGAGPPLARAAAVAVAGAALALTGDAASYGQVAGGLAAAIGAVAVAAVWKRDLSARGSGWPVALGLVALLAAGRFTGELRLESALACALGLVMPAFVEALPLRSRPALAGLLRVVLAVLPGAIAIALFYEPPPELYR